MKILSTADNHLGFRQYGLVRREIDIENSFRSILELGVDLGVAAVTVSGDILHSVRPTSHTIQFLKTCQEFLEQNELPCLVSIGNHDNSKPHWLRNLSNPGSNYGFKVLNDELYRVGDLVIYGKTFCSREEFDKGNRLPESIDMLLMHQSFNELTNFPSEKSFSIEDFENVDARVVVIGDTHIHQSFDVDGMTICSPGSSELISESEESDKFVFVHDFSSAVVETESHKIETRKVIRFELRTEEDVDNALVELDAQKSEKPLVFLKFDTELTDVLGRFRKKVDPTEVTIRPKPIIKTRDGAVSFEEKEDLTFSDILKELIPDKPSQFELVSQLLNPEADVNSLLDTYVQKRLEHYEDNPPEEDDDKTIPGPE